ncbi:UDP-4-amino-4,6-dideoxy-N-acetyl-beta-L-altrosamine transaminase [Azospirillum sp. SYSU D00513]|uniref:UDP-4-amino-4, 6-dideoxy-N-acetyl-beta-L-altrosamine transaminase n=1 Tax=Azospirillum sp. SYSU D00513 TaxID=2812561 RepID=UPI001A95C609|nr:UDP-4-amino-4,6-dideoxy-N-acetyl-beta-L-altrosamine transaminase [Azospirillum sp. SYSU D00513]
MAAGNDGNAGGRALPYGRQSVDEEDVAAVVAALRGDYLTTGPLVDAFERRLAGIVGAPQAVACANGTAALHLAMLALGIGPGDVVVVPAITFLATANAARFVGAEVAFADVDPDSGLMEARHLAEALDRARALGRPRAAAMVHLNGQSPDMGPLAATARDASLFLVEDACHALGTAIHTEEGEVPVGACDRSDLAVFSFHPVKTVTTAEGGAVTSRDPALDRRLRLFRNHGMVRDPAGLTLPELALDEAGGTNPWYYEMQELGFNYRLNDVQCALGLAQLGKLDRFAARRRALADRYDRALAPLGPLLRPVPRSPGCRAVPHLYPVLVDFAAGTGRAALMRALAARGVGTQVHYIPVPWQPYYRDRYGLADLPGARRYYERVLSLPLFADMEEADADRVAAALAELLPAGA